jgi:hypothetical protein
MTTESRILFLVSLASGEDGAPPRDAVEHLELWSAERCTEQTWIIAAPVTARAIYDGLASTIGEGDRLLVAEIHDALWHNLMHRPGQTGGRQGLVP